MKIVFIGPPGSGKSTLIEGFNKIIANCAFDLENIWHQKELFDTKLKEPFIFYGGAGFDVELRKRDDIIPIILTLPEAEYIKQRDARDSKNPAKKDQVPLQGALNHMKVGAEWATPMHPNDAKRLINLAYFNDLFKKSKNEKPIIQWAIREFASKDIPDRADLETKMAELDPDLKEQALKIYDEKFPAKGPTHEIINPGPSQEVAEKVDDKLEDKKTIGTETNSGNGKTKQQEVSIPIIQEKNQIQLKMPADELIKRAFPPELSTRALLVGFEEEKIEFRKAKSDQEIIGELADIAGYCAALKKIKPSEIPVAVLKALEIKYLTRQECYQKLGISRNGYRSPRKLATSDAELEIAREYRQKEESDLAKLLPLSENLKKWGKTLCI